MTFWPICTACCLKSAKPPVETQAVPRGEDVAAMFQKLLDEKLRKRVPASQIHEALQRIEQRLLAEWGIAYGRQWDDYIAGLAARRRRPTLAGPV